MPKVITVLLVVIFSTRMVYGDTLRCRGGIIAPGDSKVKVIAKCGKPFFADIISGADQAKVEQWYFKLGTGRFIRVLTFKRGQLISIKKQLNHRQP
jgi:hypothetical protein